MKIFKPPVCKVMAARLPCQNPRKLPNHEIVYTSTSATSSSAAAASMSGDALCTLKRQHHLQRRQRLCLERHYVHWNIAASYSGTKVQNDFSFDMFWSFTWKISMGESIQNQILWNHSPILACWSIDIFHLSRTFLRTFSVARVPNLLLYQRCSTHRAWSFHKVSKFCERSCSSGSKLSILKLELGMPT